MTSRRYRTPRFYGPLEASDVANLEAAEAKRARKNARRLAEDDARAMVRRENLRRLRSAHETAGVSP